jgi:hypothetical protein
LENTLGGAAGGVLEGVRMEKMEKISTVLNGGNTINFKLISFGGLRNVAVSTILNAAAFDLGRKCLRH